MKLHLLFMFLVVALVTAVAIPDPASPNEGDAAFDIADVSYPGQKCRGDWACPSSEYCNKKGRCAYRQGRCGKDKDCPKYHSCSDTHCFPHSHNGRRDIDGSSDPKKAPPPGDMWNCVGEKCSLKPGRCLKRTDCRGPFRCKNTHCRPILLSDHLDAEDAAPAPTPVEGSEEETNVIDETDESDDVDTADNIDLTPLDEGALLAQVKAVGKRGNKCRRTCRYHTDCCAKDACWNMTVCLGPHKGG